MIAYLLRLSILLPLLCLALCIDGCQSTDDPGDPPPIVLGAIYNLTGSQSGLDLPSSHGAQLAVDEIDRAGGIDGRRVDLIVVDGRSDTATIRSETADLLARYSSVAALLGLSDTDMLLAAAPVAAENGRLFVTSGATSPKLPAEVPTYLFLACFGDNVQAAAAAEWAYNDRTARTVSVIYNSGPSYTRLLQEYFTTRFTEMGGQVLSTRDYSAADLSDLAEGIGQPDVVFLAAGDPDEALAAIGLIRQAGFTGPILGGDSFDSENLWGEHAEVSDVFFTTHAYVGADNPDPKVVAFRNAYEAAYPGEAPSAFAALGYDAARLVANAASEAASSDPKDVLAAMSSIRQFDGVTGTMTYPAGDRIPTKSVTILEVRDGARRLVRQFVPESVPAP